MHTALKEHDNKQTSSILSQPRTLIVKAIDEFDQQLIDWRASDRTGTYPHSLHIEAIKGRVQQLVELGFTGLGLDIALFAMRLYVRRNFISHGESFDLYMETTRPTVGGSTSHWNRDGQFPTHWGR